MEIVLPSKPKIIKEEENKGVYKIEGLYPGYGHTLGNSLRRILLSSLPGAAVISVKIDGVDHEFSTIPGVKEDVINILLNLKNIRLKIHADEPQILTLKASGQKKITAKDLTVPAQVEIINKDTPIATLTSKNSKINMELVAERGMGYVPKETSMKEKVEVGMMVLDAIFTPIKRVSYDVENMRVGDRTDFNRLRISVQTDGTISPKDALESAVKIMIRQLEAVAAVVKEEPKEKAEEVLVDKEEKKEKKETAEEEPEKIKIEDLGLSARTEGVLREAGIKSVGGILKRKEESLLEIEGLGEKALTEIRKELGKLGLTLKNS